MGDTDALQKEAMTKSRERSQENQTTINKQPTTIKGHAAAPGRTPGRRAMQEQKLNRVFESADLKFIRTTEANFETLKHRSGLPLRTITAATTGVFDGWNETIQPPDPSGVNPNAARPPLSTPIRSCPNANPRWGNLRIGPPSQKIRAFSRTSAFSPLPFAL